MTDENSVYYRRKPDGTPELPLEEELSHDLPDRQLAAWDLSERILVAWRRDLSAGRKDAQKAWAELAGVSDDGDHVRVAVQRLLALTWWERLFTRDRSPRISVALPPVDDSEGPAIAKARRERAKELSRMDGFAVAFSEGIEVVLEPWLSGSTSVDYGTITEVMRWVGEGMMTPSQRERLMALMQSHDPEE